MRQSAITEIVHFSAEDDALIWDTIRRFAGVPLSHADASLIVLSERLGIRQVFTFDEDFRSTGMDVVPGN